MDIKLREVIQHQREEMAVPVVEARDTTHHRRTRVLELLVKVIMVEVATMVLVTEVWAAVVVVVKVRLVVLL